MKSKIQTLRIVTSFITYDERLLILKRSDRVRTMRGLWAGVSGVIEGNEVTLERAKIEILEETGITEDSIVLIRAVKEMTVCSPQYRGCEWRISPFLFEAVNPTITLNWENAEFRWIDVADMNRYSTVPSLHRVLSSLL